MFKEKIEYLQAANGGTCVTISLNTHRTHPENRQDDILLKNLCREAERLLLKEINSDQVAIILDKLENLRKTINVNDNLDSLHLFVSSGTTEIIRLGSSTSHNLVHVSDTFMLRPLINAYNRSVDYLILLLSQSGVRLFEALNESIVGEIENGDFPFPPNGHFVQREKRSDPKKMDNLVREYLNKVDKAAVRVFNNTQTQIVSICTEDNYSRLMQVADRADIYLGFANIDYNNTALHQLGNQAWPIARKLNDERTKLAISEMKEAVAEKKILTDLEEIAKAASDGRGNLLIVHQDFFESTTAKAITHLDQVDDAIGIIALDVISQNGRTIFTDDDGIKDLGEITMKVRY